MSKKYRYVKTWTENGKRKVVRADDPGDLMEKYYFKRYGIEGVRQELTTSEWAAAFGKSKKTGGLTVREWAEKAVELYKKGSVSDDYYYNYVRAMKKHVLARIGEMSITEVIDEDCQQILNTQKGMSQNHINQIYQILTFVFGTAYRRKIIKEDPTRNLIKPKAKEKQKRRALTEEERAAILEVFEKLPEEMRVFKIMYYTGARPSEVWRMRKKDIMDIDGQRLIRIRGTKTKSATRSVPFPDAVFEDVESLKDDDLLITSERGYPMGKQLYKRRSHRLMREMDIIMGAEVYRNEIKTSKLGDFVPYDLRHDYCSRLRDAGIDIRLAQRLMGHSTIATTVEIYTHINEKDIAKDAASIIKSVTEGVT